MYIGGIQTIQREPLGHRTLLKLNKSASLVFFGENDGTWGNVDGENPWLSGEDVPNDDPSNRSIAPPRLLQLLKLELKLQHRQAGDGGCWVTMTTRISGPPQENVV